VKTVMPSTVQSKGLLCLLAALLFELVPGVATSVRSEQLPIKTYTTADGLARDDINQILRDSRGFLWFSTDDGLSRFDGYKFINYTTQDGLPSRSVNGLLETRAGAYWLATAEGVCRFSSASEDANTRRPELKTNQASLFVCYRPPAAPWSAKVLLEDRAGVIWCGAGDGLYRLEAVGHSWQLSPVDLKLPSETPDDRSVQALTEDSQGGLWIGTVGSGVYQRQSDGHATHYTVAQGLLSNRVNALLADTQGNVWVGTSGGLSELAVESGLKRASVTRTYTTKDGLAANWIYSLFQTSQGQLWVGSTGGLSKLVATAKTDTKFNSYTEANGLSRGQVMSLGEDRDGNLWIGMNGGGALKLAHNGFTTFTQSDGLTIGVNSIFENQTRELCIIYLTSTNLSLKQFDGARFNDITPRFPRNIGYFGWGWNQDGLQDHAGEWWLPTGNGLCRFPKSADVRQLAHTFPKKVYTSKDGLPVESVFRLFEDSYGNIWISTISPARNRLTRWERDTETLHTFKQENGLLDENVLAVSFVEDAAGSVWIGTSGSRLLRYRAGHFDTYTTADGVPTGSLRALYIDHAGRLWIAANTGGLGRIDDPMAERPTLISLTTADGLSSNVLSCITEDLRGRIYVGHGRGVDRIDPESKRVKHYTAADGLFRGEVQTAYRDQTGALWFGSPRGLARFVPETEESTELAPPIFINSLRIGGEPVRLAELGAAEISGLELAANRSQIQIDFVGLDFGIGETLRYQYKLEGADAEWSAPTDQRSINFARLPSGVYRFLVRAMDAEGHLSPAPAIVAFQIFPPFYRRWWFIGMTTLFAAALGYASYRYRLAQLLALERVRTHIATDLHDDIGSNLSLIAGLSELLRQQARRVDPELSRQLSLISIASRKSVDAMSDIVWAVNPQKDHLRDLTRRMRRFASDTFTARAIRFHFNAPAAEFELKLDAQARREIFLIFKEAVNNIARHSTCTVADIGLVIERGQLRLFLRDDGNGFAIETAVDGQGLTSMKKRAAKIGGELLISSSQDGTEVVLLAPMGHVRLR
jgi:ligand-binding sensor domain-containing protein/signal transduction histidine kinase